MLSLRRDKRWWKSFVYPLTHPLKQRFHCVICNYRGPFINKRARKKVRSRLNAKCPRCSAVERHQFQWQVLQEVFPEHRRQDLSVLHMAPEPCIADRLKVQVGAYLTAGLNRTNVDIQLDIRTLPFAAERFDLVLSSHVLQYVEDDVAGIKEVARVLKPGGIALLPVPLLHQRTRRPNILDAELKMPHEPGPDYYERYRPYFEEVTLYSAADYDEALHFLLELTSKADFPL